MQTSVDPGKENPFPNTYNPEERMEYAHLIYPNIDSVYQNNITYHLQNDSV